jgi:N-acyl-D-aspartate/D-glutamate deacylase
MNFDLIIRGGTVIDGTRLPRYRADVAIKDGRVAKIGRIPEGTPCERELDAEGCYVVPGFVDLHCHYDAQIHWDPYCTVNGWHGVTSLVLGNCGFGFAPVRPEDRVRAMQMMTRTEQIGFETMEEGMPWRWESFPEWLDNLDQLPKGINCASFVPATPLMVYVMGLEASKSRPATAEEREEMQRLLDEALEAGACGFSLQRGGLNPGQTDVDGTPMPTDCIAIEDVMALAEVLRSRDQGFIQIAQSRKTSLPETREEALKLLEDLALVSGRPVIHNVIHALDEKPEMHIRDLAWLSEVNAKGARVIGQGAIQRTWFEFTLERWNTYDPSPAWKEATLGTTEEKIAKLSDPDHRAKLRAEHDLLLPLGIESMPEGCFVMGVAGDPSLEKYVGRNIGEIAKEEGRHPTDVLVDIALATNLNAAFRTGNVLSADPIKAGQIMNDPYVIAGISDGGAHTKIIAGGTYPTEILTWLVRDEKQLTLEEAHYRLSYLPAQMAGLTDRGFLREGAPADIVVYDLEKLRRVPEWSFEILHDVPGNEWRCVQRAEGYRWTIVNGVVTFEDGSCTGATPGVLLRNGQIDQLTFA